MGFRRWVILCGWGLAATTALSQQPSTYRHVTTIPIGGEGGWDIPAIDSQTHLLYLSHSSKIVVVDLVKNALAGEIKDTPGVHTFFPFPELQIGFSSNGKESKVAVVDLKSHKTITKIATGENPDAMTYDQGQKELYVFNHNGKSVTVISPKTQGVVTTIPLPGSPEFGVADPGSSRVYCNLEDKSEVAVIDSTKHRVIGRWPLAPGEEPTGIALDSVNHRLFSACHNKMLVMLDTKTGKVIRTIPIGAGTDGCTFDEQTGLIFASCGDGTTTIAIVERPEKLVGLQTLPTERGARTIALDPVTHRIYLPTADFEAAPAPSPGVTPARPKVVSGTLRLLVYAPEKSANP